MAMSALEVGAKVRVLGGPFAGRVGIISELDGKGGARVALGLLSARVLLENLRPAPDVARPALRSSHHRPEASPMGDVRGELGRSKKSRALRKTPPK
jgi:hypothetical protein